MTGLRRAVAVVEGLVALISFWILGIDSFNPGKVGGDGIGTGIAKAFAPAFTGVGLILGYAAWTAWKGLPRWGVVQLRALSVAAGLIVLTIVFLIATA